MQQPLWQPSLKQIDDTLLTHFISYVCQRFDIEFVDYDDFYAWSVSASEQFWDAFWDFSKIKASIKGSQIINEHEVFYKNRFFPQSRLNYAENILSINPNDEQMTSTPVLMSYNETNDYRSISYTELYESVATIATYLKSHGVMVGDRVAGLLPNIPEAIIAALATISLGAIWVSCSPEFGEQAILDRFHQIQPKILFVTQEYAYKGKIHNNVNKISILQNELKTLVQTIIMDCCDKDLSTLTKATIRYVDVVQNKPVDSLTFAQVPFDHPLFIMFSSGTTGVPKCIIHGHGGTLIQHLKEHQLHCDLKPGDRILYYTSTSWMMWNWLLSGLASQATLVLYNGSPFYPDNNKLFDIVDQAKVTHLGISAKYIEALIKAKIRPAETHNLQSLKMIMSTGSPLSVDGFHYIYDYVAHDVCLASISGGTDILSCFALGNPIKPVWAGELQTRGLAMAVKVYDKQGLSVQQQKGELVCIKPFPSMPVGFWNDPHDRKFHQAYFAVYPNIWHHGDYIELTEHQGLIIHGRSDTVLNPGGVRIGTAELYRQLEDMTEIWESLVVGQQWRGDERIILFVVLKPGVALSEALCQKINLNIKDQTTPRHVPAKIIAVDDVPRTTNGKISERAVKDVIHGRPVNNINALANPEVLNNFKNLDVLKD